MATRIRVLGAEAVRAACSMSEAIDAVAEGFDALSGGRAVVPLRVPLPLRSDGGTALVMPAAMAGATTVSVKVASVAPANAIRGLELIQAAVLVIDADTGELRALLEGRSLTALRTGAAGGLAARRLAREDTRVVALYGAGAQAWTQLEAVLAVRAVREVRVVARRRESAEAFVRGFPAPPGVRIVSATAEAARDADIVICATSSATPVFDQAVLGEGVHITAVGSFRPDMCEVDPEALRGARVVVDQREAALAEAGEIVAAVAAGILDPAGLIEIGGTEAWRRSDQERTVFKSVGNAIQDLVVASRVVASAERQGAGTLVEL